MTKQKLDKGFTLIELMVVMALMAVLATLIIGAITLARRTATETTNRANAKIIQTGLESYYATNKQYPAEGTSSFEAMKGTLSITTALNTTCTGTGVESGGKVTIDSTRAKYWIYPYNYDCTSTAAGDLISTE